MSEMSNIVLSVKNLNKTFGGVHALKDVNLDVKMGEVHCLAGENGSGKSTLIKNISGVHEPDSGEIIINGKSSARMTPAASIALGVQIIYQDFSIFPNLTVIENLALNKVIANDRKIVNKKEFREIAEEAISKIDFDVDLDALVEDLPVADKQLIAISRALLDDVKILVMDEPTTALTNTEISKLFKIVEQLKQDGVTIIFISHKLDEIFEICDTVTILRDGENVITAPVSEMDEEIFSYHMTGRRFDSGEKNKILPIEGKILLQAQNLSAKGFESVNLEVREGEILGVIGQLGSGLTELTLALFGMLTLSNGKILIEGKEEKINSAAKAEELGLALVPEDRLTEGLFLPQSISRNINVTKLDDSSNKLGVIDGEYLSKVSKNGVQDLGVVTVSDLLPVSTLSGGNQQKVLLARWLATQPKVLMLNGPTVGVDIGAKYDIHSLLKNLRDDGMGVIIASDDIKEVVNLCNRVLVMEEGKIIKEISADKITEDEISNFI